VSLVSDSLAGFDSAFFSAVALAGLVTAVPTDLEARQVTQCNTGSMQCCTTTMESSTTFVNELYGFLGLPIPTTGGSQVGLSCSPVTVGGTGSGSACTQQPVCCAGNVFNGVINVGCSPITING